MMPDDLERIPFDWIAEDIRKGEIIPFFGAGASVFPADLAAKPPSAASLARELAKESKHPEFPESEAAVKLDDEGAVEKRLRARLDCANLALVSSWVEHVKGDRPRLRDKLRGSLAPDPPLPCNDLHRLLANAAQAKRPLTRCLTIAQRGQLGLTIAANQDEDRERIHAPPCDRSGGNP